jgi:hypothetical protein
MRKFVGNTTIFPDFLDIDNGGCKYVGEDGVS